MRNEVIVASGSPGHKPRLGMRLEEMVLHISKQASEHAGVTRRLLDNLVIGASDELDSCPIFSMLMTAPARVSLLMKSRSRIRVPLPCVLDARESYACSGARQPRRCGYQALVPSRHLWRNTAERSPNDLARMKQMVNDEMEMQWNQAVGNEFSINANHLGSSKDLMKGLRAFREKRKPAS